MHFIIYICCRA